MAIYEDSLYGTIFVETSPNTGTATWTDQTATLVNADVSRAGQENYVGLVQGEIGTGSFTFFDNTSTILPGYWIRLRVAAGNIWSGYVVNVSETVTFVNPNFLITKRVTVADWVSYVSQMNLGPYSFASGVTTVFAQRATQISNLIGSSNFVSTNLITAPGYNLTALPVMPVSQALDLSVNSIVGAYWKSTTASPVSATNRTGLIKLDVIPASPTATATFTDGTHTGTPANLCYYTTLDISNDSSEISNSVTINNVSDSDLDYQGTWSQEDATSITTFGRRFAEFDASITPTTVVDNIIPNPNLQLSSDYILSGNANQNLNRQLLSDMATGATNFLTAGATQPVSTIGDYIAVARLSANTATTIIIYNGPENNGTASSFLVRPSSPYTGFVYLRGGVGQSSMAAYCAIRWYDVNGATISTTNGTSATLLSTAWNQRSVTTTSPANAYSAVLFGVISFSGTNNTNNRYFATGASLRQTTSLDWVAGDIPDNATYLYDWAGQEGQSASYRWSNQIDVLGNAFLAANSTSYRSPRSIQWNVQQNLSAVDNIDTYSYVDVWFQGTKWTQLVTGITHQIEQSSPTANRWLMRISLRPTS
jgi:hypothetical protein